MAFSPSESPLSTPVLTTFLLPPPILHAPLRSARSAPTLAPPSPKPLHASDLGLTTPRRVGLAHSGQYYNPHDISRSNSPIPSPSPTVSARTDASSFSEESESSSIGLESRIFFRGTTKPSHLLTSESTLDVSQDGFSDTATRPSIDDASIRRYSLASPSKARTFAYSNQEESGSGSKTARNGMDVFHSARHSAESTTESTTESGMGCCTSEEYATAAEELEDAAISSAENTVPSSVQCLSSSQTGVPPLSAHDLLLLTPPTTASTQTSFKPPSLPIASPSESENTGLHIHPTSLHHETAFLGRTRSNSPSRYQLPSYIRPQEDARLTLSPPSTSHFQTPIGRLITPPRSPSDCDPEFFTSQQSYAGTPKSAFVLGDVPPRRRDRGRYSRRPRLELPVIAGSPNLAVFSGTGAAPSPASYTNPSPTKLFLFPRSPPPPPTPLSRFSITPSINDDTFPNEDPNAGELQSQFEKPLGSEKGSGTWRGHAVRKSLSAIVNGLTGQKNASSVTFLDPLAEESSQASSSITKANGFRMRARRKSDAQSKKSEEIPRPSYSQANESHHSLPDKLADRAAGHVSFTFDFPRPPFHDSQYPRRSSMRDNQSLTGQVQPRPPKRTSTISASSILLPAPSVCRSSVSRAGRVSSSVYSNRSRSLLLSEIRNNPSTTSLQDPHVTPNHKNSPARTLFFAGFALSPWCWVIGGWLLSPDGRISSYPSPSSTSLLPFSFQGSSSSLISDQDPSASATIGSKPESRTWPFSLMRGIPFHFKNSTSIKATQSSNHPNLSHEELYTREPPNGSNADTVTLHQFSHDPSNSTRLRCPSITFTGPSAPPHDASSSTLRYSQTPSTSSLNNASRLPRSQMYRATQQPAAWTSTDFDRSRLSVAQSVPTTYRTCPSRSSQHYTYRTSSIQCSSTSILAGKSYGPDPWVRRCRIAAFISAGVIFILVILAIVWAVVGRR